MGFFIAQNRPRRAVRGVGGFDIKIMEGVFSARPSVEAGIWILVLRCSMPRAMSYIRCLSPGGTALSWMWRLTSIGAFAGVFGVTRRR